MPPPGFEPSTFELIDYNEIDALTNSATTAGFNSVTLCMAGTSVCEILLAVPISSGVDVVPFLLSKDCYSLFLVDGVLIH